MLSVKKSHLVGSETLSFGSDILQPSLNGPNVTPYVWQNKQPVSFVTFT